MSRGYKNDARSLDIEIVPGDVMIVNSRFALVIAVVRCCRDDYIHVGLIECSLLTYDGKLIKEIMHHMKKMRVIRDVA
jgi:hypothetical protein